MKTCIKCSAELDNDAAFCTSCGEPQNNSTDTEETDANLTFENSERDAKQKKNHKKGYFYRVIHYTQLEKKEKSKCIKQTIIGGLICIAAIVSIPVISVLNEPVDMDVENAENIKITESENIDNNNAQSISSNDLPDFIISADTSTGFEFDCTYLKFIDKYNSIAKEHFGNVSSLWTISASDLELTNSDSSANQDIYTYYNYVGNSNNYQLSLYVDQQTNNVIQFSYFLDQNQYDSMQETAKDNYGKKLPEFFVTALGFETENVWENYWQKCLESEVDNTGVFSYYIDGSLFEFTVFNTENGEWMSYNCVAKSGENESLSTDNTTKQESNSAENNASYIEMAKNIAVYQIKKQTISKDEPDVYDAEIVSSDGNGRYIITATTKSVFETYWAVFVEILDDNNHYNVKANYHGDGITVNDWISKYKTESEYSWGKPQAKYQ